MSTENEPTRTALELVRLLLDLIDIGVPERELALALVRRGQPLLEEEPMPTENEPTRTALELVRLLLDLIDIGVPEVELAQALEQAAQVLHDVEEVKP